MTVSLDLPPQLEQSLLAEAQTKGVSIGELLRDRILTADPAITPPTSVFEQGLGLLGSPEDAAILDEVVSITYEERRRQEKSTGRK